MTKQSRTMSSMRSSVRRHVAWLLPAVLCLALGAEWVRSYWVGDAWFLMFPGGKVELAACYNGRVGLALTSIEVANVAPFSVQHGSDLPESLESLADDYSSNPYHCVGGYGCYAVYGRDEDSPDLLRDGRWAALGFPIALPVAALGFVSLRSGRNAIRATRRSRAGQCLVCGYDLRFSPDRCPECGTVRDQAAS